jgi:hypothetical protein
MHNAQNIVEFVICLTLYVVCFKVKEQKRSIRQNKAQISALCAGTLFAKTGGEKQ